MKEEIKVSVCCFTYNHAPYLRRALDSVIMQNVNFKFEIIIGDDCSTDDSQSIIAEYADKYPNHILAILQPVNTRGTKNFTDVYKVARGKYIIVLETDDYWTSCEKLQKQVDYLDSHSDYIAVAHNCIVVDQKDSPLQETYPSIRSGNYTYKDFGNGLLPGQTTTLMYKNPNYLNNLNMELWDKPIGGPGDVRKVFCLLSAGKIFTLPETMSAYRHIVTNGISFSATHKRDDAFALKFYKEFQNYSKKFDNKEMRRSADVKLIQTALGAYMTKTICFKDLQGYIKSSISPCRVTFNALFNILRFKLKR